MGSGMSFIRIYVVNGVLSSTEIIHLGPNIAADSSRSDAIVQSSLQAAHENTQRMVTLFNRMLSGQPADVQRDVNEVIHNEVISGHP